jgi:hypothetical protein
VPAPTTGLGRMLAVPLLALLMLALLPSAAGAAYDEPVEDYASYDPQKTCRDTAKPGTKVLAGWINRKFSGGTATASIRACSAGGTTEHKDGRAIDWSMDATKKAHRLEVKRFLAKLFAEDTQGNAHAKARRMGVMYIIWNDRMHRSYQEFAAGDYRPCTPLRSCSATVRHRDHVHISLSRAGGKGATSWYAGRG